MSKLGLLTFAELSTLAGLVAIHTLDFIDFDTLLMSGMVVIAAFFVPSLLAIRDDRKARDLANG